MNLNSDLIDKTLLENEIRNVKYKYSKRDTLYLNDDNEQIRIKREVSDITNAAPNNTIFNINYRSHNLNTGEEFYSNILQNEISEKEILRFSNKFFKNIIKTKHESQVYGSSYNKFFYYTYDLHAGDQKPGYCNHVTKYPDMENESLYVIINDLISVEFYEPDSDYYYSKSKIYFDKTRTLSDYHYINSQNKRYFYDYLDPLYKQYDGLIHRIKATFPFEPHFEVPDHAAQYPYKIRLKGSYKDSFKFNYSSQGAEVPDHVNKNLYGIYSHGADYRFTKLINIFSPDDKNFTGWTHEHNGTKMSTNKGYADEHWSVGENPQFMFGSDDLGIINTDELKTISNEDLRFIENWYTFNNKNNKKNYFGIISNKKILNIFNPFLNNKFLYGLFYNYSNLETKHYCCGRYVKRWGQNENHGSATQPNWVWQYYWDEIDYYSKDKYNYGMHCGYGLNETINRSDNLGITKLSKSKLSISIIKKNNNYAFLNTNNKLQINTFHFSIPKTFTIEDHFIL